MGSQSFYDTLPDELPALRDMSRVGLLMVEDDIVKDEFPYELEAMVNTYLTEERLAQINERASHVEPDNSEWPAFLDEEL